MWRGFVWIVGLIILLNLFATLFGQNLTAYFFSIRNSLTILAAIFAYALLLSLIHLALVSVLFWPFGRKK